MAAFSAAAIRSSASFSRRLPAASASAKACRLGLAPGQNFAGFSYRLGAGALGFGEHGLCFLPQALCLRQLGTYGVGAAIEHASYRGPQLAAEQCKENAEGDKNPELRDVQNRCHASLRSAGL
jgi:hypothetical protein